MATTISTQDIVDAKRDIEDIGKAVNEKVIVSPRYGGDFKSLPMIASEAQGTIDEWRSAISLITQEGGVPALAVSDASGLNQQEVNNGVESIADLIAIPNPKNGNRVYVKSYHDGLGKGGRDFVYDESKSTVNDGVMVFNGWVSQTNPSVIDAFEAGCAGIGDHSSYLDHEGMRRIAKYITDQYSLGNKKFTVKFSVGDYVCQKEGVMASEFRTFAENSFKLTNMPDLELTLDFDNANFITRSGMRVGSFNRSDMSKYTGAAPFFGNASTVFFTPDHPFSIVNIKSLNVLGNSAHNGNISNHIVGGVYGDIGIQWASIGFFATQIDEMTFDGIHVSHSHSNDGWYLAGRNPTELKDDLSDGRFMSIRGLVATNNGRNGISFTGGKNSDWYSCYSFNNGLSNHPTASNPRSNIDIEAEVSPIRRARFYNFKSHFAGADGLVSDIQDSRDVVFYDSEFINTTRSLWVNRPQFKFYNCYISGSIISGYAATTENDRTRFVECTFDNATLRNPNVVQTGYLFTFSGRNPLFKDCTVNLYGGRLAWAANAAIGSASFKGLTLNVYGIQQDPVFGEFEYEDVVINDLRVDPSVSIAFSLGSSSVKNMRILCETQQSGITINGNYNFTKKPQSEKGFVKYFADTLTYSRQTAPLEIVPKFNTQAGHLDTSTIKVIYADNITQLTNQIPYEKGTTVHCTDPVGQSGIQKWVCTTAGYYNANNWAASTAYAVNSFINANNKVYKCTIAGTSGATAPSHSGGTATDGSATWEYIGSLAVFTSYT